MNGQRVIDALQAQFGGVCELVGDLQWALRCREIERANGFATLDVDIWGHPQLAHIHLAGIAARPPGLGVGTEAMELLAEYCRPRGISIDLHALQSSATFFGRFDWLREQSAGSRDFTSTW